MAAPLTVPPFPPVDSPADGRKGSLAAPLTVLAAGLLLLLVALVVVVLGALVLDRTVLVEGVVVHDGGGVLVLVEGLEHLQPLLVGHLLRKQKNEEKKRKKNVRKPGRGQNRVAGGEDKTPPPTSSSKAHACITRTPRLNHVTLQPPDQPACPQRG